MNNYQKAQQMAKEGLLTIRKDGELEIFCYSRETFLQRSWNEITLSHRGLIYLNGKPVNKPFDKIFNIGEVDGVEHSTIVSRMAKEKYDVLHKSNGHLLICSMFFDEDDKSRVVWSTKGSLATEGHDMLNDDITLVKQDGGLESKLVDIFNDYKTPMTFMFEAIVEHDKHAMFESDKARYGIVDNGFILLGVNYMSHGEWKDMKPSAMQALAKQRDLTCVKTFSKMEGDISNWYNHSDTEGYVIRFENGDRVKVKTKEYWRERFVRDLTPERFLNLFASGGFDRISHRLPEEVSEQVNSIILSSFHSWVEHVYASFVWLDIPESAIHHLSGECINKMDIPGPTKSRMFSVKMGESFDDFVMRCAKNKDARSMFRDDVLMTTVEFNDIKKAVDVMIEKIGENCAIK